ncbi:MAG: hypothetical protein OEQ74_00325 [Gammaproteobacteria bacterium]|nr:hypothetical protein [Gammaproteobacteria bacterium]
MHPLIFFNSEGFTHYNSAADEFAVVSIPLALQETLGATPININQPAELTLTILVDGSGTLAGGVPGPDLVIIGDGQVLLEGEILEFEVFNSSGPTDTYGLIFSVTGGTMAGEFAGANVGISLISENSTFDGSFDQDFFGKAKGTIGRIEPAVDCKLTLDKTCLVVSTSTDDLACSDKISAARFRYIGPTFDGISQIDIFGTSGAVASYSAELVTNETVFADQNGYSIDATLSGESDLGSKTTISINGVEEVLHTSCSAPFVAGAPAPLDDPKGDPSPNWLVEAFIDKDGNIVELPTPEFADSCEIPAPGDTICEKRPTAIQFRYTGGDCLASKNDQPSDKFECEDFASANGPVAISIFNGDKIYASISDALPGTLIDATAANAGRNDFDSEVHIEIRDSAGNLLQFVRLHTSCSQPLALGDSFGGMEVTSFTNEEQGTVQSGAEVIYQYVISNTGQIAATNIVVTDTALDPTEVPGSPIALLNAGVTEILQATTFVDSPVNGTASLIGYVGEVLCEAEDTTPISIATPPPCSVGSDGFEIKDDAFKWDLSNTGIDTATIESMTISWPAEFGNIKEIKLEGDKIFAEPLAPSTAIIDSFSGNIDDRQIEATKTDTLEIKFESKYKEAQPDDFEITVVFAEGCEITFEPGSNPFGDCDGKIRELTMIWDGMIEPVNIRAYAGDPGSDLVYSSGDLYLGNEVTVGDFTAAGAPNDVYWEVLDSAGNLLGESKFHRSCSDDEMDGPEDCGMPQGNGKNNDAGLINDWLLEGMRDDDSAFDCSEL